jgi:phosphomannomutase
MTNAAPLMLSVSGARGIVGESMTEDVAARFAAAWGAVLSESCDGAPMVCLGRDSRPSGAELAAAAARGLQSAGCDVIDIGLVATPTAGVMTTAMGAQGGLVITASHNPTPWNGLKCIDSFGAAPSGPVAMRIIDRFHALEACGPVEPERTLTEETRGDDTHLARVFGQIEPGPIQAAGLRVVLDSVNGAGCNGGQRLLSMLDCDLVHLNGEPTGHFAHAPEPTETNLVDLARATADEGAAVGFAQDPDADRLAIIDEHGRYIGEEYTLALVTDWMLRANGGDGVVVTNLSTSRMVDDLVARHGGRVVRTAVGEANVVEAMRAEDALLGGEGNGGVILPGVCHIRDSLGAMAMVLASMADSGRPLSELVDAIPTYAMVKTKYALPGSGGAEAVASVLDQVRAAWPEATVNDLDGVRLDFADAWVHVRASNTEPIARIIAEAPQREAAMELVESVAKLAGWSAA